MKIAINGFGRIGRLAARIILDKYEDMLDLTAINTSGSMPAKDWVHLLKYDSSYGQFNHKVSSQENFMQIKGKKIPIYGEREPGKIPWQKNKPELVLECTGAFRKENDLKKLLTGSVKKLILSAPPKEGNIPMYLLGVNDKDYKGEQIISCASCTTNCIAPIMMVLQKEIGIKKALLNTIHAYTSDQSLLDGSHKDLRRARSAAINIIPTSTGAAKAVGTIIKSLDGRFDGLAVRVPVAICSLADLVIVVSRKTTPEEINNYLVKAEKSYLANIIKTSFEPLVSSDVLKTRYSAVVDLGLTNVVGKDLVRVIAWYDNEWAYTNRLVELALKISNF